MPLAEIVDAVRVACESGKPVNVVFGDHGNTQGRMWWSHVCVAELMRLGWVEQVVDLHPKKPVAAACALIDVLPPLYTEPRAAAGPAIYVLTPDQLQHFEFRGTWIVAGVNGNQSVPLAIPHYWVQHFDISAPGHANAVEGFDAESFFASLLQVLDEFPPRAVLAASSKPQCVSGKRTPPQELQSILYRHAQQANEKANAILQNATMSFAESNSSADVLAMAERLERDCDLASRLSSGGQLGSSIGALMGILADSQSPRTADAILERTERLYRKDAGCEQAAYIVLPGIASTLSKRAKLHSGAAAEKMYGEADRLMAGAKAGTRAGDAMHLTNWGEMLAEWAGRLAGTVEAEALFERGLEKLEAAIAITPKDVHRRELYVRVVESRARKLGAAMPARYFDAARVHCKWLIDSSPERWRGYFCLGLVEVYQTRTVSEESFHRAMELAPQHKAGLLAEWGTALMESGLLDIAYAKFTESAAIGEKAFIPHANMSAIRLRQARGGGGEPMLHQAVHHAEIAESLSPGTGAYNLACAVAHHGDREGVEKWLSVSAEKGRLHHRDAIETDPDFRSLLSEPWFGALLDKLLPSI